MHGSAAAPVTRHDELADHPVVRNPGVSFDRGWIDSIRVNLSAIERRIDSLSGRRTV
jgi:hypothetical protein